MSTIELVSCISNCGRKRSTEADGFEVAGIDENGRVVWWCCLCAKKQAQSHGDLNKARVLWKEDKIKVASVSSNLCSQENDMQQIVGIPSSFPEKK